MTEAETFRSTIEICAQTIPVLLLATVFSPTWRAGLAKPPASANRRALHVWLPRVTNGYRLAVYLVALLVMMWDIFSLFFPEALAPQTLLATANVAIIGGLVGALVTEVLTHTLGWREATNE